ncbi:hypothetical protein EX30DRAFT_361743 [Ascodesmis nigricans]|uniref:Uncharacterized protein n=1 Tax=Ascodesmis nigricans TaxID=341454 RepID=A0A4S2N422_9PEZI|nr:hypothetical protein EX30DRAFT_361743 [Ascodesmis nigricans]
MVVKDFRLEYNVNFFGGGADNIRNLDLDLVPAKLVNLNPSPWLREVLSNALLHMRITSRTLSRKLIDNMLLTVISRMHEVDPYLPKLHLSSEVAFKYHHKPTNKLWNGRLDYSIGIDRTGREGQGWDHSMYICDAWRLGSLEKATALLTGYLAVLRESRISSGRPDKFVYGATSDGVDWQFYCITSTGVLKISRRFSLKDPSGLDVVFRVLKGVIFEAIKEYHRFDTGKVDIVKLYDKVFDEDGDVIEVEI